MLPTTVWASEALVSGAAALVWMSVGLRVANQRASIAAPLLFIAGAATAWFLNRGIVHSTSPYYGLFSFASSCFGGLIGWILHVRRDWSRAARVMPIVLPPVVVLVTLTIALFRAPFAVTRAVIAGDSVVKQASVVPVESGQSHTEWYVWSEDYLLSGADSTLQIEMDPGSGFGMYDVTPVRDAQQINSACSRFRSQGQAHIDSEIAQGVIPGFITRLPVRYKACERGQIWVTVTRT